MGSGATLAVGLLGVEVSEEVGDVARVAPLLGGLPNSSLFKLPALTLVPSLFCSLLTPLTVADASSCVEDCRRELGL